MEASAFYATACRFNSSELIQVFKVISDNHANPAEQISAQLTEEIISAKLDSIDVLIQQLLKLEQQQRQQIMPEIKPFQQRWHFTVSQQHQLQRQLQRWQVRSKSELDPSQFKTETNSKAVIASLEKMISKLPMRFDSE